MYVCILFFGLLITGERRASKWVKWSICKGLNNAGRLAGDGMECVPGVGSKTRLSAAGKSGLVAGNGSRLEAPGMGGQVGWKGWKVTDKTEGSGGAECVCVCVAD